MHARKNIYYISGNESISVGTREPEVAARRRMLRVSRPLNARSAAARTAASRLTMSWAEAALRNSQHPGA